MTLPMMHCLDAATRRDAVGQKCCREAIGNGRLAMRTYRWEAVFNYPSPKDQRQR